MKPYNFSVKHFVYAVLAYSLTPMQAHSESLLHAAFDVAYLSVKHGELKKRAIDSSIRLPVCAV